ncbi:MULTISPECIES: hypothetical protein [Rhizobium]|uniref:hypothetical protein n=1 Tax=Rhizobium TaxID=379 RepID=UPI001EF94D69|nr:MULTISPECIES: hypothetical protein [Rhizobium]ULJ81603.1 hypothetical protein MF410_27115 [Rhizobium sp. C104]
MSEIVVDQKSAQQYGALCFGETPEAPKLLITKRETRRLMILGMANILSVAEETGGRDAWEEAGTPGSRWRSSWKSGTVGSTFARWRSEIPCGWH